MALGAVDGGNRAAVWLLTAGLRRCWLGSPLEAAEVDEHRDRTEGGDQPVDEPAGRLCQAFITHLLDERRSHLLREAG